MSGKSPGQILRESLDAMLPDNLQWTAQELAVMDLIEDAADRRALLKARFRELVADPQASESRLASLQAALHQLDSNLFRWVNKLDPTISTATVSRQHQQAALIRWHGANSGA